MIGWFQSFSAQAPVASALIVLAAVAMLGIALGTLKVRGVGLGIAAVLFVGLFVGHLGIRIDEKVQHFAKETGLVFFVYGIGIQVGPGLLNSMRQSGLKLNLLAVAIIALDVVITVLLHKVVGVTVPVAAGIYAGAVTNTPSLAAAQQVVQGIDRAAATLPGLGYAMAYPGGVLGIIACMIFLRVIFRIDPKAEAESAMGTCAEPLTTANVLVTNPDYAGMPLNRLADHIGSSVVVSRHLRDGVVGAPANGTKLQLQDTLLAVGTRSELSRFVQALGEETSVDLRTLPSPLSVRRIVVTRPPMQGRCLGEVTPALTGVALTRVRRSGLELSPSPDLRLQMGDVIQAVGEEQGIQAATALIGNSTRELKHPQLIPILLGVALGVALGSVPIPIPGLAAPLKLGLAGGPLLVALLLSGLGRLGPLVWYLPVSANFILRELGIVTFLACVGVKSGEHFVETLVHGGGLTWMLGGLAVTVLPLLIVGLFARIVMKLNFMSLCGLIAGSMTDPPALAFAGSLASPQGATVAYATVYPLVMILRVISVQVMVLLLVQ